MSVFADGKTTPSYHRFAVSVSRNDEPEPSWETKWCITIRDGKGGEKKFITLKSVALHKAITLVVGGATAVWFTREWEAEQGKLFYIIKRSWRPYHDPNDGALVLKEVSESLACAKGDKNEVELYCDAEHQGVLNTAVMQKLVLTRRTIKLTRLPKLAIGDLHHITQAWHTRTTEGEVVHQGMLIENNPTPPIQLVRGTNLITKSYGWPLYCFKDLGELVPSLRGAVEHHRDLYLKGVLHRDVSPDNIWIFPELANGSALTANTATKGRLIDLDHLKVMEDRKDVNEELAPLFEINPSSSLRKMLDDDCQKIASGLDFYSPREDFEDHEFTLVNYVQVVKAFWKLPRMTPCSKTEIHWHHMDTRPHCPDFSRHVARHGTRTGTTGFVSYEVAKGQCFTLEPEDKERRPIRKLDRFTHDGIHDIESFLWVLVYICLTREGPGNKRRFEFEPQGGSSVHADVSPISGKSKALIDVVKQLFHDDDLGRVANAKQAQVQALQVLEYFHPYFSPIRTLAKRWWALLQIAYKYGQHELRHIHDCVLDLLDETLEKLKKQREPSSDVRALEEAEIERRVTEWRELSNIPTF